MGGRGHTNNKRKGGGDDRLLKRDFKKSRDNVWDPAKEKAKPAGGTSGVWGNAIERENKNFEAYYKAQKICPEDEWDAFMACLRTTLPTSFRINGRCACVTTATR